MDIWRKWKLTKTFRSPLLRKLTEQTYKKNKRKAPAFVGGAINKWGDLAAYTPETEKRRKIVNKTEEQLW